MSVRNFLTLNAVLVALVALTSLFTPELFLANLGHDLTTPLLSMTRVVGAVIIGNALISWILRDEPPSGARKAFLLGIAINYLVFAAVNLYNMPLNPELEPIPAWGIFALNLAMGLGFVYFWRKEPTGQG